MDLQDVSKPVCNTDPYAYLQISRNPDGSINRGSETGTPPITTDDQFISPILIKDVPLDPAKKTWFRIYVPRFPPVSGKLPLVVYSHGGGFIVFHATSDMTHRFCTKMALQLPAVVVSLEYRLAPEHKLPAAYEDAIETIHKVKNSGDEWLSTYVDLSNCYLMGSSSGGNIAFHAGLRLSTAAINGELEPLKIRGLILHQAFFGGVQHSSSELRLINDIILPLSVTDLMWELALPVGANRDHEFSNLNTAGDIYKAELGKFKELGWRVLAVGVGEDPLIDRQVELVRFLEKKGVEVESEFIEGGHHVVEFVDDEKAKALNERIKSFISKNV